MNEPLDRLAMLTQRSVEAEEAWKRKRTADAIWHKAQAQLRQAIEDVRELLADTGER